MVSVTQVPRRLQVFRKEEIAMRLICTVLGTTLVVGLVGSAWAEPGGPAHRKEMLKKFDADGDGVLSEEERAAARDQRAQEMIEEFDGDSDSKLDLAELKSALQSMRERLGKHGPRGHMRQRLLKDFDADGDGKLSDEERAAAHKAMQERREKCLKEFDADGDGTLNEDERAAAREARGKRCRAGAGPRQD